MDVNTYKAHEQQRKGHDAQHCDEFQLCKVAYSFRYKSDVIANCIGICVCSFCRSGFFFLGRYHNRGCFGLIIEISDKFDRVKFNEAAATRLACKMSVKANTNITYLEQEELLNRLFKCDFPYTCPHGRPTIIKYPIYELEKLFKRVNS